MTAHDEAMDAETESIAMQFELGHPPAKVWRALTDPVLLTEWLLPIVQLSLEPGATFTFQAPPQPGWDGTVNCRLLEIDEPRRLRYAWVVGDLDTEVDFTLAPTSTGTRLSLLHSGFRPDQRRNSGGARYGWKMMTGRLVELLGRIA
ncbi:MAG: SRPBCC domain-containing protein [Gemmatimonadaceae bacterium]